MKVRNIRSIPASGLDPSAFLNQDRDFELKLFHTFSSDATVQILLDRLKQEMMLDQFLVLWGSNRKS